MWIRAGLILGLALLFTAKWKDWSVREVQSRRDCRDRSIFLGDETVLSFYMENRKILPLPWIQWEMDWPEGLEERDNAGRERLVVTSSLLPFQRLKRRVRVQAKKRGYYVFKETRISIGDLLGLAKGELVDSQFDALSVYPQVEPLESLLPLAAFPQGNVSVRRWILPDAFQPIGARSYVPGDPIRNMDWKATARRGSLMVREFGYTAEPRLSILLHMGEDFRQLAKPDDRGAADRLCRQPWGSCPRRKDSPCLCNQCLFKGQRPLCGICSGLACGSRPFDLGEGGADCRSGGV